MARDSDAPDADMAGSGDADGPISGDGKHAVSGDGALNARRAGNGVPADTGDTDEAGAAQGDGAADGLSGDPRFGRPDQRAAAVFRKFAEAPAENTDGTVTGPNRTRATGTFDFTEDDTTF